MIKIANPKNRIEQFKITDPSLKFFIYKYENEIPWDTITDSYGIKRHIADKLLHVLKEKIDPKSKNNNYFVVDAKYIEEESKRHPEDAMIQRGYALFQTNPQEGIRFLSNLINNDKFNIFHHWWDYMHEKDKYKDNPAFLYSVLKPIIDSSSKKDRGAPPPLNEKVLAY